MMTVNNNYLDGRQFFIVDNLGMRMLRSASGFLCVAFCVGMSLFGQQNALRDVDERLNQLSALEQVETHDSAQHRYVDGQLQRFKSHNRSAV
jgi:hypothetical protein